ncbi:3-oxoacyl-[acyl-carrier-protein] reductase [Gudongella oleilytica]|jgi:3-oxoacyl-[acyl-carrier protein] reductase|uniref:3-oxoacyl-[acyl-carrier-protein] reductase n=1 Tax=Gudongella oleilytica TaxID=1582259 RepID=UPI000EE0969A|nr:3-oxoacyl-[acyl-carrier-protein] reductase [Gudongella oleilytica]HCO19212.1 3-oxoacyl-[acyl-carrier-protein] reductase [Tissierellales bacterium]
MKGKTALVTGGSRGIGREIALGLAARGCNVAITFIRSEETALKVVDELIELGVKAVAVKADTGNKEQVEEMVIQVEESLGRIDILVNNAGITRDNLLIRMSEDDWDQVMQTNLKGAFLTTKAVVRGMMKNRYGKIINISSVVGVMGNAGQANYSASKAGLIGLTKSTAKELASRGIRVNAIAPGFIKTDMTDALKEEVIQEMLKSIPLGYLAEPKEISNLVNFLASEDSDYITGQVIQIDGGMHI